jgi:regulatory protein
MGPTLEQTLAEAFKYLGPRERTVAEVCEHLARSCADVGLIEATIVQLRERGYLDDARYARCFAEDRRNLDHWGSERICRRLLELGIPAEVAHSASEPEDREQELEMAVELLRRRIRAIRAEDPRSRKRALYSALRRFEQRAA